MRITIPIYLPSQGDLGSPEEPRKADCKVLFFNSLPTFWSGGPVRYSACQADSSL